MHQITVASDGTITRAGAKIMRANGVAGITGSTTLASARAKARTAGKANEFEFVKATRPDTKAKAKRTRKVQPTVAAKRKATAWECGHTSLREHIAARCNGQKANA